MPDDINDPADDSALRALVQQALAAPAAKPSAELRRELEQRLDSEAGKVTLATDSRRRLNRPGRLALLVSAALVILICLPIIESRMNERPLALILTSSSDSMKESGNFMQDPTSASRSSHADDDGESFAFGLGPNGHTSPEDFAFDPKSFGSAVPQNGGFAEGGSQSQGAGDPSANVPPYLTQGVTDRNKQLQSAAGKYGQLELAKEQAARRAALSTLRGKQELTYDEGKRLATQAEELIEKTSALTTSTGPQGGEQYDPIYDNPFLPVKDAPLSTFSIDVDTASYANIRRFLLQGQLPPKNAVRIEELLNYFSYDYPAPAGDEPFSVNMETAPCPWQPQNLLLRVGLKGKEVQKQERPASNLVFLIDVSGSMSSPDKLPLLKQSLTLLTRELGERDKVTIVTYAGEAGLKLEPTNGSDKQKITSTIDSLHSDGSTNGSAGIQMAYEQARSVFVKGGTNRVILCTDGDLNVGVTSDDQLVELIAREAKSGVFLTVLGFGTGNLKDSKLEKLADHGNGIYAYIDGLREAKKVLVEQMSGSLVTIAKDVKLQIEFNPAQVRSYRLVGYENRILAAKDFNDDTKDAGEIGAGHTVTALYELVPADAPEAKPVVDELKYQGKGETGNGKGKTEEQGSRGAGEKEEISKELLTLKLRYKESEGEASKKVEYPLSERGTRFAQATSDFRFAAAVAGFGMLLRESPHRGEITLGGVAEIATSSLGDDKQGYRAEFLDLVRRAGELK